MRVAESRVLSYFVGLNDIFVRCEFLVKGSERVTSNTFVIRCSELLYLRFQAIDRKTNHADK